MLARIAMIAITTSSSMSVKPFRTLCISHLCAGETPLAYYGNRADPLSTGFVTSRLSGRGGAVTLHPGREPPEPLRDAVLPRRKGETQKPLRFVPEVDSRRDADVRLRQQPARQAEG